MPRAECCATAPAYRRTLEARLAESDWLAGDQYGLADIGNFAIADGMQNGFAERPNTSDTPGPPRLDRAHQGGRQPRNYSPASPREPLPKSKQADAAA